MDPMDDRRDSKWDTRELHPQVRPKKKKPTPVTYMGPPAYLLETDSAIQSTEMIDLTQDNSTNMNSFNHIASARVPTRRMPQAPRYFSNGTLPGPLKPEKMLKKRTQWDHELREGLKSKYEEQLNSYTDVRDKVRTKKRRREATPEDDYPIPVIDDMNIHPNDQIYVGAISGRQTFMNPSKHWRKRLKTIVSEEDALVQEELQEYEERRQARRKRDEAEQYEGLKTFNGRQRGWDGLRESDRQEEIGFHRRQENREAQDKAMKNKPVSPTQSEQDREYGGTTAEHLKAGYTAFRTRETLSLIALDDAVKDAQDETRAYSNSLKWDYDVIVAEARGKTKKPVADNTEESAGRRGSTASFIPLSPTEEDEVDAAFKEESPVEEDEADAVFEEEKPSPNNPKKRRLRSPGELDLYTRQ